MDGLILSISNQLIVSITVRRKTFNDKVLKSISSAEHEYQKAQLALAWRN